VSGNPTITNSGVTSVNGSTGAVTIPSGITATLSGAKTATGAYVRFTVPTTATRITMVFNNLRGTLTAYSGPGNGPKIQFGTGGVPTVSGYTGGVSTADNGNNTYNYAFTTGFIIQGETSNNATIFQGSFTFVKLNGNIWVCNGTTYGSISTCLSTTVGSINLTGSLDTIQISPWLSTDTFSTGTVNVYYE
jgi:hypothetical protein